MQFLSIMEHVWTCLGSSSIHGLSHISKNQNCKKFFWLFVVVTGFSTAFILISTSFQSWRDSPVKTLTETLPISYLRLPKVTVCPPKNTFTDLNYDLMLAEDKKLTDEKKDELYKFAVKNAEENSYMDALNQLQEEKRFYNWYHGYSSVEPPKVYGAIFNKIITTNAVSGSIAMVNYGQKFQPYLVRSNLLHKIHLRSNTTNPNTTLHIEVEKISMIGLTNGKEVYTVNSRYTLDANKVDMHSKFTPPGNNWYSFDLNRKDLSAEDIRNLDLKQMPGFRFRWYHTGEGNLTARQLETKYNPYYDDFTRYFY